MNKKCLLVSVFCTSFFFACTEDSGSSTDQEDSNPKYATMPTNQNKAKVQEMYNQWMGVYYVTYEDDTFSGNQHSQAPGTARIKAAYSGSTDGTKTCSEAIGYGMFLAAVMGDWERFDKLNAYSKLFHISGTIALMRWDITNFAVQRTGGSATDADLDIMAALFIAYQKTKKQNYLDDALAIGESIYQEEVHETSKLILPARKTETWSGTSIGSGNLLNISYMSLPVLKKLTEYDDKWNAVLEANLSYMEIVQNNGDGLWPDWSDAAGSPINPNNGSNSTWNPVGELSVTINSYESYYKETPRIPWRIAWYYQWYGDSRAKAMLDKGMSFLRSKDVSGPGDLRMYYSYTGNKVSGVTAASNAMAFSSLCALGMGSSDNLDYLNACNEWLLNNHQEDASVLPGYFNPILSSYYRSSLQLIYAMLFNGMF